MNLTYIVPVPKCTRAQISKNFRFISLYNVLYKIILKILVNKLKSIFLKIIDQQQSSFLPFLSQFFWMELLMDTSSHPEALDKGILSPLIFLFRWQKLWQGYWRKPKRVKSFMASKWQQIPPPSHTSCMRMVLSYFVRWI